MILVLDGTSLGNGSISPCFSDDCLVLQESSMPTASLTEMSAVVEMDRARGDGYGAGESGDLQGNGRGEPIVYQFDVVL